MATIEDQLAFEEQMIYRGVDRYRTQQEETAEKRGAETSAGSTLLRSYVLAVADHLTLYLSGKHPNGRRRNKVAKLLETIDVDKVALLSLRSIINAFYTPKTTLAGICTQIGRRCEDELRFMHFETEYKEYYDSLIRDFKRRKITSYDHRRRVLRAKGADQGQEWEDWSEDTQFSVGSLIVSLLMEVCDLVEREDTKDRRGRISVQLVPTQACIEWVSRHNEAVEILSPDRMPCLIPPDDWTSYKDGGFYSPRLRARTPLIKANYAEGDRDTLYSNAHMPDVMKAVNAMQKTAWRVNTRVHDIMKEVWSKNLECGLPRSETFDFPICPLPEGVDKSDLPEGHPLMDAFNDWKAETRELYTAERERRAKNLALYRTMTLTTEMREHEEFYYVYQCDFRGRTYATASGLNPQGTDQSKGLIEFANGKPLGATGYKWFMINAANKYGYDKVSYADRVKWVEANAAQWLAAATDPISHRDVWSKADKPWQFLAWCFEFYDMLGEDNHTKFVSRLPVGLDGSCNGLQHFSAMLRDSVGGRAVNLIPADCPADIYQAVADVCYNKLKKATDPSLQNWLWMTGTSMPRTLTKAPVMTLPYGSTQNSCTSSVFKWLHEKAEREFPKNTAFKQCIALSPVLWESIGEVVIAARAAMDWIQECAGIISKAGHDIQYTSPLGFPVLQRRMRYETKQIETQIGGRLRIRIASFTDNVDVRKQRQGSSPNMIHHVDACHMMMTLVAAYDKGMTDFAMIHDDFGTHACDAEMLQLIIRETFVKLHTDQDILEVFKNTHEDRLGIVLPPLPPRGDLDLNDVLRSEYFFG
jgi:DNA-directed RNA polymerase